MASRTAEHDLVQVVLVLGTLSSDAALVSGETSSGGSCGSCSFGRGYTLPAPCNLGWCLALHPSKPHLALDLPSTLIWALGLDQLVSSGWSKIQPNEWVGGALDDFFGPSASSSHEERSRSGFRYSSSPSSLSDPSVEAPSICLSLALWSDFRSFILKSAPAIKVFWIK